MRNLFKFVMAVIIFWMVLVSTGEYLPYIDTSFAWRIRYLLVFPVLLVLMVWFFFIHKWAESGKTGYQMRMVQLTDKRTRVKETLVGGVGVPFISVMIAATAIDFTAWAAFLAPGEPVAHTYAVVRIKAVGSKYDVVLHDTRSGEQVTLRQSGNHLANRDWRVDDVVCVRGKTSLFGTTIDSVARNSNNCK